MEFIATYYMSNGEKVLELLEGVDEGSLMVGIVHDMEVNKTFTMPIIEVKQVLALKEGIEKGSKEDKPRNYRSTNKVVKVKEFDQTLIVSHICKVTAEPLTTYKGW